MSQNPIETSAELSTWQPNTLPWDLINYEMVSANPQLQRLIAAHQTIHRLEEETLEFQGIPILSEDEVVDRSYYRNLSSRYGLERASADLWLEKFFEDLGYPGDYHHLSADQRLIFGQAGIIFAEQRAYNHDVALFSANILDGFINEYVINRSRTDNVLEKLKRRSRKGGMYEGDPTREKGKQWGRYFGYLLKVQNNAAMDGQITLGQQLLNMYGFESLFNAIHQSHSYGYPYYWQIEGIGNPNANDANRNLMNQAMFYFDGCHNVLRCMSLVEHPLTNRRFDIGGVDFNWFFGGQYAPSYYFSKAHPELIPYLKYVVGVKVLNALADPENNLQDERNQNWFRRNVLFATNAVRAFLPDSDDLVATAVDAARLRGIQIPKVR